LKNNAKKVAATIFALFNNFYIAKNYQKSGSHLFGLPVF